MDYVDLLVTPQSFGNPAGGNVTNIKALLNNISGQMTTLAGAIVVATTPDDPPPVPPATDSSITITNAVDTAGMIALCTQGLAAMDTYETHTNSITNTNVTEYVPTYNDILSASATIQNATLLKAQADEAGKTLHADYADVDTVGVMTADDLLGSISQETIAAIEVAYTAANDNHVSIETSYTNTLAAVNGKVVSADPALDANTLVGVYGAEVEILKGFITDMIASYDGVQTSDVDNYNTIDALGKQLSEVALLFAGLNDPILAGSMGDIAG